jgi:hypothetical protein
MSAITPWAKALEKLLPLLRDCPAPMATLQLVQAAREYFDHTSAWGLWTDDLFTVANSRDYVPFAGREAEVLKVRECKVGATNFVGGNEQDYGAAQNDNSGTPIASWFDNSLYLWPVPTVDELPIRAYLLLRPKDSSTGLPQQIWVQHIDSIVIGALRNLFGAHDKPYSDASQHAKYEVMFKRAKDNARSAATKGGFARKRVVYHGF